MCRRIGMILVLLLAATSLLAQENPRVVRLAAPNALIESGLLKYMLPRFSLKTQIRVEVVPAQDDAEARIGDTGTPVFSGAGQLWRIETLDPAHTGTERFVAWVTSEIGQRSITGFTVDGAQPFALPPEETAQAEAVVFEGDAIRGKALSRSHCGRCHVVIDEERMNAIGSSPSFFVLRGLPDWDTRFQVFYVLNPHPSFTQIEGLTEPFPPELPSPMVPIEMSQEDLDAILAYAAALKPADLGAPLQHQ